jgi:hypothetical protein
MTDKPYSEMALDELIRLSRQYGANDLSIR